MAEENITNSPEDEEWMRVALAEVPVGAVAVKDGVIVELLYLHMFRLEKAYVAPSPPEGRATIRQVQLNRQDRLDERDLLILAGLLEL